MKKKLLILFTIIMTFTLCGCGTKEESNLVELTFDELTKKVENKEDFILVIESDQCSACAIYMPTMEEVVKNYNVKVNYINIHDLTDEQSAKLATYVYTNSTPLTVYFKEGVASDTHNRIVGAANYDAIVESFTKNGYIGK